MNWARAKSIVLVLLIVLNLFLLINVISVKNMFALTSQYQQDARRALEASGIVVAGDIPSYNKPIGRISYIDCDPQAYQEVILSLTGLSGEAVENLSKGFWETDGKILRFEEDHFFYTDRTGTVSFPIENEKQLNKQLLSWIRSHKISAGHFIQDKVIHQDGGLQVEYVQKYKDLLVFSNRIRFTMEEGKLTRVEGSMRIMDTIKPSKADEILSANIVLLIGKDKIDGVIEAIDLGYMRIMEEDLYHTPVWRMTKISGERIYFNAYTGEFLEYKD